MAEEGLDVYMGTIGCVEGSRQNCTSTALDFEMKKLHFEIEINASKKVVWNNVIQDKPFREWTKEFADPSFFEGDWSKGSKIRFLTVNKNGNVEGMSSEIADNKPYDFLSIRHLGYIKNGEEDLDSEEVKSWAPAYENYSLKEENNTTKLTIDVDSADEFVDFMNTTFPMALNKLKEICQS